MLVVGLALSFSASAIDALPFRSHAEELRFQALTRQLRCLVCQNESLADSGADLAKDLRAEVFEQMQAGKSDEEIEQYLTARYGDFVLYDPPVKPATWLLWFGPLLVFGAGAMAVAGVVRRRQRAMGSPGIAAHTPADNEDDW
ncbi:MAG TPA: cytochrome c-type biogenesis protein [Rhodanobacteraceae bacterium]|nr:cytochrome c-type biogenesis protein [Rhodanobacteraceae bacterium]